MSKSQRKVVVLQYRLSFVSDGGRLLVPTEELMRTRELWSELSAGFVECVVPRQHREGNF